ncbi:hypothetical protein TSUD_143110 [Trifolium subterraneum]|uniref:Uncharacterized protein n=1 Tax=Trifolium subterraneum TaxID=3900 RepID=A0A2Z6PKV2_TRISU|nr:hypothetical protein TSUD_143110 [Trifolium subterraneum]
MCATYHRFTRSRLKNGRKKSKNCVHLMPQMRKQMLFCKMLDMYFSSVVMISEVSLLIPNINQEDAAVVAREDLLAQLRTLKKRLKEAEEEQYRAEEDAAALRAELNSIQQQSMTNTVSTIPSLGPPDRHLQILEKELAGLKLELQRESLMRHQGQQQLANEQSRIASLMSEKQELEEKLNSMSREAAGSAHKN